MSVKKECEREAVASTTSKLVTIVMAPMPSRLEDLAIQLGTQGGTPRFWAPDPLLPITEYERGVPPPAGHIWWRFATQLALGEEGCKVAGVPPLPAQEEVQTPGGQGQAQGVWGPRRRGRSSPPLDTHTNISSP